MKENFDNIKNMTDEGHEVIDDKGDEVIIYKAYSSFKITIDKDGFMYEDMYISETYDQSGESFFMAVEDIVKIHNIMKDKKWIY